MTLSLLASPGAEIRNHFRQIIPPEIGESLIVYYTKVPFEEATRTFDAGAHIGTAILCRSSLETAFFLVSFGRWDRGAFFVNIPTTKQGKKRIVAFEELRKDMMKAINFSKNEIETIRRIQEHGNFGAHFAALRIEGIQRWEQDVMRGSAQLLRINPTPEKWRQLNERLQRDAKIWVTPIQALSDLRQTLEILKTVFRESARRRAASLINVP
jgi:hypothetical protein